MSNHCSVQVDATARGHGLLAVLVVGAGDAIAGWQVTLRGGAARAASTRA